MVHFTRLTMVKVRRSKLIGSHDKVLQLFRRIIIKEEGV